MDVARTSTVSLRRGTALSLAVLASFGLVAAPVLHAEQHAREADDGDALDVLVHRIFEKDGDFDEVFARVWDLGHRTQHAVHTHSHSPANGPGRSSHGDGSLQHFALAVQAPPPPPALQPNPPPPNDAAADPDLVVPARLWWTPELAQGPPVT